MNLTNDKPSEARTIDLNADVGEGVGDDDALIPLVTSVNVACGVHAGDQKTMRLTLEKALAAGVAIGAHPGHNDREAFGRLELDISPKELIHLLTQQIEQLDSIAGDVRARLSYVKLHGGLYHQTARDEQLAAAAVEAIALLKAPLAILGLANSALASQAASADIPFFSEAFADRAYRKDGALVPRSEKGAVLDSPEKAAKQATELVLRGTTRTLGGEEISVACDSLCVHGDNAHAVEITTQVRSALLSSGVKLKPFTAD